MLDNFIDLAKKLSKIPKENVVENNPLQLPEEKNLKKPQYEDLTLRVHSKWGILSSLMILVTIALVCLAVILGRYTLNNIISGNLINNMLLHSIITTCWYALICCVLPLSPLIGMCLAFIGVRNKNHKNFFSVIGIIMNGIVVIPIMMYSLFGMLVMLPVLVVLVFLILQLILQFLMSLLNLW